MKLIVNADDFGYTPGVTGAIHVEALLAESSYASERGTELEVLTDPAVREAIGRLGIERTTFAAL